MPRGGARPGAGRKPKVRAPGDEPPAKKTKPAATPKPAGYSPKGVKVEGAPAGWPFGTEAPAPAAATAPVAPAEPPQDTSQLMPLDYMLQVMRDQAEEPATRRQMAIQAAPYCHAKKGEAGKKATANEKAKEVARRFQPSAPPKLVAAGGQKV